MWAGQATAMKTWLWRNISVNIQGRIMFLCTAFPLTHYVYYKFYLNVNSSFLPDKVPDGRTDGRTKRRLYASPFGEHRTGAF